MPSLRAATHGPVRRRTALPRQARRGNTSPSHHTDSAAIGLAAKIEDVQQVPGPESGRHGRSLSTRHPSSRKLKTLSPFLFPARRPDAGAFSPNPSFSPFEKQHDFLCPIRSNPGRWRLVSPNSATWLQLASCSMRCSPRPLAVALFPATQRLPPETFTACLREDSWPFNSSGHERDSR